MVDSKSNVASQALLLPGALNPRGLVLTPLLIRILALVAVMLLANLS